MTGETPEELFSESAIALFSTITDPEKIEAKENRTVHADGEGREELMINFLRMCLDLFSKEEFVGKECEVQLEKDDVSGWSIAARLCGERYDPSRHPYGTEIKAVTYHDATVRKADSGWEATFTLDL